MIHNGKLKTLGEHLGEKVDISDLKQATHVVFALTYHHGFNDLIYIINLNKYLLPFISYIYFYTSCAVLISLINIIIETKCYKLQSLHPP